MTWLPIADDGTVNVAENVPVEVEVTVAGVVVTVAPSYFIVTVEEAVNP
jgi:hypothetical protein